MGIGFLGIGFQPKWRREDIPIMPKVWVFLYPIYWKKFLSFSFVSQIRLSGSTWPTFCAFYCYLVLLVSCLIMLKATTDLAVRFDKTCSVQGRYDIMRNYMPKVGTLGLDMMLRTCTVQVRWIFRLCVTSEFYWTKFLVPFCSLVLKLTESA